MQTAILEQTENIYTVSRLNSEVRAILEQNFAVVWVEGEISNFASPQSGHLYFALKDESAQVKCAMFRMNARKLDFAPKDGAHVLIKARVSLYENRGDFQLIAESMEERGEGKLRRAFELLKKKLEAAGLFEQAHKKPLPLFPKQIGVITSPTGAAIRDILTVLKRRYACVPVIIYPTLVQGETASANIVSAIQLANRHQACDVLILSRGGGSLEDLWPFNEENVAHAIFQSELPIISGVGHEVDFTIADFVADQRAPTPSAAAEILTPDAQELLQQLHRYLQQITNIAKQKLHALNQQMIWMQKHLTQQHPKRRLQEKMQHLDVCENKLTQLQIRLLDRLKASINHAQVKLQSQDPQQLIMTHKQQLLFKQQQLLQAILKAIANCQTKLANQASKLDGLRPLGTLQRGFAIVSQQNGKVLFNADDTFVGENLTVRLHQGELQCTVDNIIKKS